MSRLSDKKVLSFRRFERSDAETEVVYDIAWPVEVVECYANKVLDTKLDALAETILELLTIPEMSKKKIASLLFVSEDIIQKIIVKLTNKGYYADKYVTQTGLDYLKGKEDSDFSAEKVFGNMFISMMDGEVFPYFYEEKLPRAVFEHSIYVLSYDKENERQEKSDFSNLDMLDKINRAYHKYGRIYKMSKERTKDGSKREIDFCEEELQERDFNEVETMEDVEAEKCLKKARIKILNTEHKKVYIKTRVIVKKADPEKFIVESPFVDNITSWYSESFRRMRENNELIYTVDEEEQGIDYFCQNITKMFYADYPELQSSNFEQYININFPIMRDVSIAAVLLEKYKEVFHLNILSEEKQQIKKHTIITESAKAIELILNNYIANTEKASIVKQYESVIRQKEDIESMLENFGIQNCSAFEKECKALSNGEYGTINPKQSIFYSFRKYNGHTVVEKYYFLIAEAYFYEKSKFRRLLLKEGVGIIEDLDFINRIRNKYGAHNDGTKLTEISQGDFLKFQEKFKKCTIQLIDYMD